MMTILSSLRLNKILYQMQDTGCPHLPGCAIMFLTVCVCVSVKRLSGEWVGGGRDKGGFWCGAAISNPRALLLLGSSFIWAIWCKHNNGRIRSSWFSATFHMKQMDHWPLDPIRCHFECLYNGAVVCKMKRISNALIWSVGVVCVLYPYTAERRDVLENTLPEAQEISQGRGVLILWCDNRWF